VGTMGYVVSDFFALLDRARSNQAYFLIRTHKSISLYRNKHMYWRKRQTLREEGAQSYGSHEIAGPSTSKRSPSYLTR